MAKLVGRLRQPESNRKKYIIIAAAIAAVCLVAGGGILIWGGDKTREDEFGRRRFPRDANLPDMHKKSAKEIVDYTKSTAFQNLTSQQQMRYRMENGRQMMDYQIETYFTTPKEQRTAYLDRMIDQMQAMRKDMEQMHSQMPERRRPDANDPNREARRAARAARMADPSNARSGAERGTALQRAQRQQFRAAMEARMKQRGISMPRGPGGGPGGGGLPDGRGR